MLNKICDKCGKELNVKPYWDIDAQFFTNKKSICDRNFYHFDLCDECMKELIDFLKHKEN